MNAVSQDVEARTTKKAKTEYEAVVMTDGTTVQFPGKRKLQKSTSIDGNTVTTRLDFRNGETRSFVIPDELVLQAAGHGIEQKLGDETAGEDDVDDMVYAVDALIDRLNKGEWTTVRESGGFSGTSVLLRALVEKSGKTVEEIKAFLSGKSQTEKMALRNSPKLKPIVDRLESEKVAKSSKVDADALLAELG